MDERRHFTRIFFAIPAQLSNKQNCWDVNLIDLSLKGALVSLPENNQQANLQSQSEQTNFELIFELPNSDVTIEMQVTIAHIAQSYIGLECKQIDIDSAAHLKRLLQLNMADETLLSRELENLIH
ncbi:hypothetical protein DS2_00645 [Catenovulum agarivorans DS-2]|uniref:Cyclic diguanosine monophosphate-binding protein n=1 Tax=Catenovulum agarivorans DS-2 TaxID=1328313 RepID=W7QJW6_9ALTE|nr:PilZ domain-containing protein [Catenovulum agarivorans]EWH12186.1 hypothetical protein DS2_00645 [Catenovulum agarivorans DS-2]